MKDEKDRIKELERRIRELESSLANEYLRNILMESMVEGRFTEEVKFYR